MNEQVGGAIVSLLDDGPFSAVVGSNAFDPVFIFKFRNLFLNVLD